MNSCRMVLGISYSGAAYHGWQSQPDGQTVQDHLERALQEFAGEKIRTHCAGRTDAGVHALMQVAHFDTQVKRAEFSWVRGSNRYLPKDMAIQWARELPVDFHVRRHALSRRYCYILLESAVRPSLQHQRVGWSFRPLDAKAMQEAAQLLKGKHDFSCFRASTCQSLSPVKTLSRLDISRHGVYWRFDFEADAFLQHMIRNIMGCLVSIGQGHQPPAWAGELLQSKNRRLAAPTFPAAGLYFLGPSYAPRWGLPQRTAAFDGLPGARLVHADK